MIALLLRLYPAGWRRRYGDEFAAVLEERPIGPFDVADVLLGALDAHLNLRGRWAVAGQRRGFTMTLRIGGGAAILFGLVWAAGLAWASATDGDDDTIAIALTMIGEACLIVAIVGLSAFQARRHPRLVWAAVVVPVVGAAVTIVGTIGMATHFGQDPWIAGHTPWTFFSLGLFGMAIGSIMFAAATWITKALAPLAAGVIGIGAAWSASVGAGVTFWWPEGTEPLLMLGLAVFSIGWIWLGVDAIRRDRPVTTAALP